MGMEDHSTSGSVQILEKVPTYKKYPIASNKNLLVLVVVVFVVIFVVVILFVVFSVVIVVVVTIIISYSYLRRKKNYWLNTVTDLTGLLSKKLCFSSSK